MSDGMNQVFLFGNLGADPELKSNGVNQVLKLSLATNRSWFDKESNTEKKETQWHRITVFGKRAEALSRLLKKGERIFVRGRIHTSSYEKDGQKKYSTEIIAEDIHFGGNARPQMSDQTSMPDSLPPFSSSNGGYSRRPNEASVENSELSF